MSGSSPEQQGLVSRRALLVGAAGAAAAGAVVGAVGWSAVPESYKARVGVAEDAFIPDAAEGQVHLETVSSAARGHDVQLFTAVPDGHGDGSGLPVIVVLHGGTATAADYQGFGFGRFVTAAVNAGAPPFVLAGADGGVLRWEPDPAGDDDPRAMVVDELPGWLDERGFDIGRRAMWGWSMGGYGALRLMELHPGWGNALAVFSPALTAGDAALCGDVSRLADLPLGVWCGTDDAFYPLVHQFVSDLPVAPELVSYAPGGHTRSFWNDQTIGALSFLAGHLDD